MQIQSFQIIPVIDLMCGQVVHAKFGQRDQYQPINSRLCETSEALDVVAALLKLYSFRTLYIADIDAIQGIGNHDALIEKITQNFPSLTIWLDAGKHKSRTKTESVLGSESFSNLETYIENKNPHVLSLDFNAQNAMGIAELHDSAKHWPDEVICMSLNTVGSNAGPDLTRLNGLQILNFGQKTPANIYAAGGVRDLEDLQILKKMGIKGALIASALHNGTLGKSDLKNIFSK